MASTAPATLLQAVITRTGSVGSIACRCVEQLQPFLSGRRVARVVQVEKRQRRSPIARAAELPRRATRRRRPVPFVGQQKRQRVDDVRLVVGDQDAIGFGIAGIGTVACDSLLIRLDGCFVV